MPKQTIGFVKTDKDELTYKVNGFAMQVHNELKPGHREKFYQRRLAELCLASGMEACLEQRVEVWVRDSLIGYMFLDLWIENQLVVECKAFSHSLSKDEIHQTISYLVATGTDVGLLYNFGQSRLEYHRIFPTLQINEWTQSLRRATWVKPGMSLPPLDAVETVSPVRFVVQGSDRIVEVPIRSSDRSVASSVHPFAQRSVGNPIDYESAGVSITAGNRAIDLMKDAVKSTYTSSVLAGIGSFGGLFDVSVLKTFDKPVLVASTDGVGTKVKLASQVGRYRSIGQDIVNHCINDILVQGARPLFFMDYFATSKLTPEVTAEVVTGVAEACKEAGMALLGGETAEMPGVYQPNEFDIAGTIIGVVEREHILPRGDLRAGDAIIGLASSGPHTNGYSLIRKIFADISLDTIYPEIGIPLSDALLAPHKSYLNILSALLGRSSIIKALAHLTGGGFIENIPRILSNDLDAVIHLDAWAPPPLWKLIQQKGNISTDEMYHVFNMGIGMIMIVDGSKAEEAQGLISEKTFIIGELVKGEKKVRLV